VTAFNINSKFNNGSFSRPAFLQDGKILIGGDFSSYDGVFTTKILKMDDAGVKDAIFKNSDNYTNYTITALYPLADKILVGIGDQNFSSLNKGNFRKMVDWYKEKDEEERSKYCACNRIS
jgi:hypothetical protein